jgi:HK97 gp10 family phage protein
MSNYPHIQGYDDLMSMMEELQRSPKQAIKAGALKAGRIIRNEVKRKAGSHSRTGNLKRGYVLVNGKVRSSTKFFVDIKMNPEMNGIFQKPINPDKLGSRGGQTRAPYGYYPESLESGFHDKSGKKTEGQHIMAKAFDEVATEAEEVMVSTIADKVNKILERQRARG